MRDAVNCRDPEMNQHQRNCAPAPTLNCCSPHRKGLKVSIIRVSEWNKGSLTRMILTAHTIPLHQLWIPTIQDKGWITVVRNQPGIFDLIELA